MGDYKMVVAAGDSGVYAGWAAGGTGALGADGRIELRNARHMRRTHTTGRQGTGSAGDLAQLGLAPSSPSVGVVVEGSTVLLGVRRAFDVSAAAAASFGCPRP